jgi:hypothetical protein
LLQICDNKKQANPIFSAKHLILLDFSNWRGHQKRVKAGA